MSEQKPPAGWYPAPHANNEMRFWNGEGWVDRAQQPGTPLPTANFNPAATVANPSAAQVQSGVGGQSDRPPVAPVRKPLTKAKKGWIIGGSIAAGLILFSAIGSAIGGGARDTASPPPPAALIETPEADPVAEIEPTPEPEPELIAVPDVVGLTAAEAVIEIYGAGLDTDAVTTFEDPTAIVESTDPAAGTEVEEGATIELTVEEAPAFTLAQQNAIGSAQNYLDFAGFSRSGLIGQLEYEGFSTEEATFGVDNAGADWNAEAAQSAENYLEFSSFSRQGLYDQLAYEGFTPDQIEFGLGAVGY